TFPWGLPFWPGAGSPTDPAPDAHELEINATQPSLWGNPLLRATISDKGIAAVAKIVTDFEAGTYPKSTGGDPQADAEADVTAQTGTEAFVAIPLFRLVALKKADGYSEEHLVYRR